MKKECFDLYNHILHKKCHSGIFTLNKTKRLSMSPQITINFVHQTEEKPHKLCPTFR